MYFIDYIWHLNDKISNIDIRNKNNSLQHIKEVCPTINFKLKPY